MEVQFVARDVHLTHNGVARVVVDILFDGHWVSVQGMEVGHTNRGWYAVRTPRRKGMGHHPAVELSDDLYTGVRRAAIEAVTLAVQA